MFADEVTSFHDFFQIHAIFNVEIIYKHKTSFVTKKIVAYITQRELSHSHTFGITSQVYICKTCGNYVHVHGNHVS